MDYENAAKFVLKRKALHTDDSIQVDTLESVNDCILLVPFLDSLLLDAAFSSNGSKTQSQNSGTFSLMYCIKQLCGQIGLAVDLITVDNLSPLPQSLGPSRVEIGTLRKIITAWAKWWIVMLVLLIQRFRYTSWDISPGRLCCPVVPATQVG